MGQVTAGPGAVCGVEMASVDEKEVEIRFGQRDSKYCQDPSFGI